MTQAQLADGTILDFPDGTPDAVIDRVVKQRISGDERPPNIGSVSKLESVGRGALYGALQQPRDVIAALTAKLVDDVPFAEGLQQANEMSLEGAQGQAQRENPLSFGGGQVLGNIASSLIPSGAATKAVSAVSPFLSKAPALANLAKNIGSSTGVIGSIGSGAIQGAVQSLMTQGDLSGAEGGALGGGLTGALGKIAKPISESSSMKKAYTSLLKKAGIDNLSAAQMTGSPTLKNIESVLSTLPFTAGKARDKSVEQLKKFTQAAMQKAGYNADNISPQTLSKVENEFSRRYADMMKGANVKIDDDALGNISDIITNQLDKLDTNIKPVVKSYLKDILDARKNGGMTGEAYQVARSDLSRRAKSLVNTDSYTSGVLKDIRNTLDAAAERSLPVQKQGQWQTLRREYANYKTIQDAAQKVSENSLEGLLSPAQLLQSSIRANPSKGQKGYGDLYNLARAGRSSLTDSVPNSGTAQRQMIQNILTGGGIGLGVGGATYGATQDPTQALSAMAMTLAAPKAAQIFLDSPAGRKWLTTGIPGLNKLSTPMAGQIGALASASIQNNRE